MPIEVSRKHCNFYIVPGNTFLFNLGLISVPAEGSFIEWTPLSTGIKTKYSVQDITMVCEEEIESHIGAAAPPAEAIIREWHIEIQVVP